MSVVLSACENIQIFAEIICDFAKVFDADFSLTEQISRQRLLRNTYLFSDGIYAFVAYKFL